MSALVENATKAVQTADLLMRDLMELHNSENPLVGLIVRQEIKKASEMKARLEALVGSLEG